MYLFTDDGLAKEQIIVAKQKDLFYAIGCSLNIDKMKMKIKGTHGFQLDRVITDQRINQMVTE